MSAHVHLLEILKEALGRYGTVIGRLMFGGVGVYCDGLFFAIISGGVLYFKVSDATLAAFVAEGSRPFTYTTKEGPRELHSYWRVPERLLDDLEELCEWGRASVAAARDKQRETFRKPRTKKPGARRGAPAAAKSKAKTR
jgi:DNA transformation protein